MESPLNTLPREPKESCTNMSRSHLQVCFVFSSTLFALLFLLLAVLYVSASRDPRWRVVDSSGRQATESEIYNVKDIPVVSKVFLSGPRRLQFEFSPTISSSTWRITLESDGKAVHEGHHPEIPFPDHPLTETYRFEPEGLTLNHPIGVKISFYPKEGYEKAGLSWPDNYFCPESSVPFAYENRYSVDDWAGISPDDPDLQTAQSILGDRIEVDAPTQYRATQVFCFVMGELEESGGIPSDKLQKASPLDTYYLMTQQGQKGFCENQALVYYLFANAAGVKTRLVDIAGKFGPLKLTGHYFCESWIPEEGRWCFVDPQSRIAYIKDGHGKPLSALKLKRHCDLGTLDECTVSLYDGETSTLSDIQGDQLGPGLVGYFKGDIVMAYKFGYPKNRSFSKIRSFLFRPTLLYAPFRLPRYYLGKQFLLAAFALAGVLSFTFGVFLIRRPRKPPLSVP